MEPIFLEQETNYLEHYGVLGMKWGVRNDETRDRYARGHLSDAYKNPSAMEKVKSVLASPISSARKSPGQKAKVKPEVKKVQEAKSRMQAAGACRDANSISKADREAYENSLRSGGLTRNQKIALGVGIGIGAAVVIGAGLYANRGLINEWTGGLLGDTEAIMSKCRIDQQNRIMRDSFLAKHPIDPADLPDVDTHLGKDTVFHRMARHQFVDGQDGWNSLFVSYKPNDVAGYKALYPHFGGNQPYEQSHAAFEHLTLGLNEDVKIPSARKRFEEYQRMMSDPKFTRSMCQDACMARGEGWIRRQGGLDKATDALMARGEKNLTDGNVYRQWACYSQGARTDTAREYYSRFTSRGYNALTDDNDCGVCSDHPVIFIKNNMCRVTSSTPVEPRKASYMDAVKEARKSDQFTRRFSDSAFRHSIFANDDQVLLGMESYVD